MRPRFSISTCFLVTTLLAACSGPTLSPEQKAAEVYVRSHIADITVGPPVLSDGFRIGQITWTDADTATVIYSDGPVNFAGATDIVMSGSTIITGKLRALTETEGTFCGGIAGLLCPDGFVCKYDGDYPDAGGTCIPE